MAKSLLNDNKLEKIRQGANYSAFIILQPLSYFINSLYKGLNTLEPENKKIEIKPENNKIEIQPENNKIEIQPKIELKIEPERIKDYNYISSILIFSSFFILTIFIFYSLVDKNKKSKENEIQYLLYLNDKKKEKHLFSKKRNKK